MAVQELLRRLTTRRVAVIAAVAAAAALGAAYATDQPVKVVRESFKARLEPSGDGRMLVVSGKLQTPTAGWTATLTPAAPQGINPAILLLKLTAHRPAGPAAEVLGAISVRFASPVDGTAYRQVTILGDGAGFTVDVDAAH